MARGRRPVQAATALPTAPPDTFWNDALEVGVEFALKPCADEAGRAAWVQGLSGRQLDIVLPILDPSDVPLRERKARLQAHAAVLNPFILTRAFGGRMHREAVRTVAEQHVPEPVLAACRRDDGESYDKTALLFALYAVQPEHLKQVFYFNLLERHGMARMRLQGAPRRRTEDAAQVLTPARVAQLLKTADRRINDQEACELRDVVVRDGGVYVFLRRGRGIAHVLKSGGGLYHGPKPEWIVIQLNATCNQARIISDSSRPPTLIATELAAAYYQVDPTTLQFDNEREPTFSQQLQTFLGELLANPVGELVLVETSFANTPIQGRPKLHVSTDAADTFAGAMQHLQSIAERPLFARIGDIAGVKVQFRNKRIALSFGQETQDEQEFIVRYSEHRLSGAERISFESYLREEYGIAAYPSEKRYANAAS